MYETVLWATDGSSVADGALRVALKLLEPGGRLIAFHCDERSLTARPTGLPRFADEADRCEKLTRKVDELKLDGLDAELVIETTLRNAAGEIARIAAASNADVIVCGSRGFGVVAGVVAGSVAMRLPHLASCPVVVVSERAAEREAAAMA